MGYRLLKDSICTSETIDALDWIGEVTFYRLLVNCDDYGVMDARPKILKSRLFPLKEDIISDDMIIVLRQLESAGLIRTYKVGGKPFLQVTNWAEHQRVRDSKHKYPTPDDADEEEEPETEETSTDCGDSEQSAQTRGDSRRLAATCGETLRLAARAGAESESESESISKTSVTRTRARDTDPAFDLFWTEYPNKKAKPAAAKAWAKLKPDEGLTKQIMDGLAKWKRSDQWTRDDGRFIPYPATWLNGRRWEDDVGVAKPTQKAQVPAQQYAQRTYAKQTQEEYNAWFEELARRTNDYETLKREAVTG